MIFEFFCNLFLPFFFVAKIGLVHYLVGEYFAHYVVYTCVCVDIVLLASLVAFNL